MQHISTLYFDYRPMASHLPTCSRHGSDVWEVTKWQDWTFNQEEIRQTVIRLICSECHVLHFETAKVAMSTETVLADRYGFGGAPIRESGLWLWPGTPVWLGDNRGPMSYFVTRAKERPRSADDVDGVVGWGYSSARVNARISWSAGVGCTGHGVKEAAPDKFSSRRAAVKWIAAELGAVRGDQ